MWILDRSQIALQRADLMFGSIAEDGSLGESRELAYHHIGGAHALKRLVQVREIEPVMGAFPRRIHTRRTAAHAPRPSDEWEHDCTNVSPASERKTGQFVQHLK